MNILLTGAWKDADKYKPELERMGHKVAFLQQEKDGLPCSYDWVEGVVCNGLFLSHPIENFKNLKYIQLTSAGFDRVPMEYIKKHNIEIHNAGGVYSIPMAEFAICGVLQLYKQSRFFYKNQNENKWEKHRELLEIYGKTVVIVGCGSVGTECAKRFSAFGCNVLGVDLYPREDKNYNKMVTLDLIDNAISDADIVVLTLPLTDETYHLFNDKRLKRLRSNAILVNISRGAVIDTVALIEILPNIGGAVLDVFEEEPLPKNNPLWDMENVIITPHNSFVGDGNRNRLNNMIISNLNRG